VLQILTKEDRALKSAIKVLIIILLSVISVGVNSRALPTNSSGNKKPVVVIDAGHGGYDTGGIGTKGSREKNNTLSVTLKLGSLLQKKGVKVVYTRTSDKVAWPSNVKLDLLQRASIANNAGGDVFISIHNNSSIYKSIRGTEVYYCIGSSKGRKLASLIQGQITKKAGTRNRGIRPQDFIVLQKVKATSVLVELGYISNSYEEGILKDSRYQQKFAEAIAEGILLYLERK
jgi:N-acetylmuramoyl-L-alanine amidase